MPNARGTYIGKAIANAINDLEPDYDLVKQNGGKIYQNMLMNIREHLTYEALDMIKEIFDYDY